MESLELDKGQNITYSFRLNSHVLIREPTYGAITIENEKEIFLERPFTVKNLDKDINKLLEKIEELERERLEKIGLITEIRRLQRTINEWRNQNEWLKGELREKEEENNQLTAEKNNIQRELEREQKWWDKWFEDKEILGWYKEVDPKNKGEEILKIYSETFPNFPYTRSEINVLYQLSIRDGKIQEGSNISDWEITRSSIKAIYQYYRDR